MADFVVIMVGVTDESVEVVDIDAVTMYRVQRLGETELADLTWADIGRLERLVFRPGAGLGGGQPPPVR